MARKLLLFVLTLAACVWLIFTKRLRVHEVLVIIALIDMGYSAAEFTIS